MERKFKVYKYYRIQYGEYLRRFIQSNSQINGSVDEFRLCRFPFTPLNCTAYRKTLAIAEIKLYNDNHRRCIMNIRIIENIETALQVIIECRKADDEVMKLKKHIELFDNKLTARLEDKTYLITPTGALYFESVDDRTFLYTADKVYEIRHRLYELEEILSDRDFIRISKSQIVNINCIKSLMPELNRSLSATLSNGEILTVSRRYVKSLRNLLGV